jgi:hypothetical protein
MLISILVDFHLFCRVWVGPTIVPLVLLAPPGVWRDKWNYPYGQNLTQTFTLLLLILYEQIWWGITLYSDPASVVMTNNHEIFTGAISQTWCNTKQGVGCCGGALAWPSAGLQQHYIRFQETSQDTVLQKRRFSCPLSIWKHWSKVKIKMGRAPEARPPLPPLIPTEPKSNISTPILFPQAFSFPFLKLPPEVRGNIHRTLFRASYPSELSSVIILQ